jgi:hypothetical protein
LASATLSTSFGADHFGKQMMQVARLGSKLGNSSRRSMHLLTSVLLLSTPGSTPQDHGWGGIIL